MDEKILDRVRKLLELANSDNANEAASALGQAQKLMARHGIGEAMLAAEQPDEIGEIENDLLHTDGKASWRTQLALRIGYANQCQVYSSGSTLRVVGHTKNRDTVRYLFTYAASEIDRLCIKALRERGNPGRTWANNFRHGAVEAIRDALLAAEKQARAEMRAEADRTDTLGTGASLVLVNQAIERIDANANNVRQYCAVNLHLRTRSAGGSRLDPSARQAGYRAGQQVDLGRGRSGALGAGQRALRG